MKHGKRIAALLLTAMLVLGMTACGGEKATSSASEQPASSSAAAAAEAPKDTPQRSRNQRNLLHRFRNLRQSRNLSVRR